MNRQLSGLRALVIGGSSGIGLAIAKGFQENGASVAIAARTPSKVGAAVGELRAHDPDAKGYVVDIADSRMRTAFFHQIEDELGTPDILVNSQGFTILKPAEAFDEDEYERLMATNMTSVFFSSTWLGEKMLARGSGSIINIASLAAHRGFQQSAVYTISKHGVLGMTKALAAEWAARGVRVNAISPGFFMTELNQEKMSAERKEKALSRVPAGRFGKIEELVGAAVFLASSASNYVTGACINVDGGYLAAGL